MATLEQYKQHVLGGWEEEEAMPSSNITTTTNTNTYANGGYTGKIISDLLSDTTTFTINFPYPTIKYSYVGQKEETMATVNLDDLFEVFPEIKPKFKKGQKAEAYAQFVADVTTYAKLSREDAAVARLQKIKGSK